MAVYRVTIPITLIVEINEENESTAPAPLLNGDSPIIATRRAIWGLLHGRDLGLLKKLGVRNTLIKGRWEQFESVKIENMKRPFRNLSASDEHKGEPTVEGVPGVSE